MIIVLAMSMILLVRFFIDNGWQETKKEKFSDKFFWWIIAIGFMPGGLLVLFEDSFELADNLKFDDNDNHKNDIGVFVIICIIIILFLYSYVTISYLLITWSWIAVVIWAVWLLITNFIAWMMK